MPTVCKMVDNINFSLQRMYQKYSVMASYNNIPQKYNREEVITISSLYRQEGDVAHSLTYNKDMTAINALSAFKTISEKIEEAINELRIARNIGSADFDNFMRTVKISELTIKDNK